jgi:hypothetical protein
LSAFREADPRLIQVLLTVSTIIPYVYPLSYLALGILAMKRSPWLATIGIIFGWLGSIAWGFIGEQMFNGNALANLGNDALAVKVLYAYTSNWQTYVVAAGWVIGHQLAYIFLGVALLRAKVVPKWASAMLIVSGPLMGPISYGTGNGWLQVAGYGLVLVGSIPAAIQMVKPKPNQHVKNLLL